MYYTTGHWKVTKYNDLRKLTANENKIQCIKNTDNNQKKTKQI